MKVLIFLLLSITLALASLEPSGYRPPSSGIPSNRYLPPSNDGSSTVLTPESHYLPTHYQNPPSQNVIPNSQYLPSNHVSVSPHSTSVAVAMPSVQYLPAISNKPSHSSVTPTSISSHYHHDDTISAVENSLTGQRPLSSLPTTTVVSSTRPPLHTVKSDIVPSSQYLPPSQRPGTFTQVIPSSNYLPSDQDRYSNEIDQSLISIKSAPSPTSISSIYLMPNKFLNSYSGSSAKSPNHINDLSSHDQSVVPPYEAASSSDGYSDNFPGYDNGPDVGKYEFEYAVKDEFGNDFTHKESQNGVDTHGVYTVLLPDGRKQIVHYTANSEGYKPSITYEDSDRQSGYDQGY